MSVGKKRIAVVVGLGFAALFTWRVVVLVVKEFGGPAQRYERPPVAVVADSVRFQPIQETVRLTGTVHAFHQYTVAPKISGVITRITKRIGDRVSRGETIARIDDGEYTQALLQAEAELKIAQANLAEARARLELSEKEFERVQYMESKGIASVADLETATAEASSMEARAQLAQAQVEQREAAVASARIKLGYTVLSASEPGFIGERFVDEGAMVGANSAVASVVAIDRVIVRTTVVERVYGRIRPGQPATVEADALPDRAYAGTVSRIAPRLDESSRVAQMEVEIANDSLDLKPGMFCKLTVVLSSKDSAQVVPGQAVVTRNGSSGVFVVRPGEGIVRYFPVEIGITTPEVAEIVSPTIEGLVVSLGQHLLQDSSAVILPGSKGKGDTQR
ncbi:MAG: efflux RND transporter periplasmic adaptor subunit [bacterium]